MKLSCHHDRLGARAEEGDFFTSAPVLSQPTARAHSIHCTPPSPPLPASRLSLPFGLRHRFPSLLPFLSIHRGDFFQHPSVSLESRREERGTGGEGGGGEDKKSTWRGNPSARGRGEGAWGGFQSDQERMDDDKEGNNGGRRLVRGKKGVSSELI